MIAGSEFTLSKDLTGWRKYLQYVADFSDLSTWGLGRWIKPGWDEPLPDVLVIDKKFVEMYRGLPFLYSWRISASDIASLGTGVGLKFGAGIMARSAAILKDLGLVTGAGLAIEHTIGISRKDDEVVSGVEDYSPFFWLSLARIQEQGYTSYDIKDDRYVFYRQDP